MLASWESAIFTYNLGDPDTDNTLIPEDEAEEVACILSMAWSTLAADILCSFAHLDSPIWVLKLSFVDPSHSGGTNS